MTADARAACRAALLKACRCIPENENWPALVVLDDAAACMAEREARLRGVLNVCAVTLEDAPRNAQWDRDRDTALTAARAALAAAQGGA